MNGCVRNAQRDRHQLPIRFSNTEIRKNAHPLGPEKGTVSAVRTLLTSRSRLFLSRLFSSTRLMASRCSQKASRSNPHASHVFPCNCVWLHFGHLKNNVAWQFVQNCTSPAVVAPHFGQVMPLWYVVPSAHLCRGHSTPRIRQPYCCTGSAAYVFGASVVYTSARRAQVVLGYSPAIFLPQFLSALASCVFWY